MRPGLLGLSVLVLLGGCGFAHDEKLAQGYRLVAIDALEDMVVCRTVDGVSCSGDELPGPTVFAAGADEHYVVIARHPNNDRASTEYYYLIRRENGEPLRAGDVVGPLDFAQFSLDRRRLSLPDFSRTFSDLK